jgi:TnpA family transposase
MARRRILTSAQRLALLALPVDRAEAARHYTLSEAELAAINRRRGDRNRLGFALQLCALSSLVSGISRRPGSTPLAIRGLGRRSKR